MAEQLIPVMSKEEIARTVRTLAQAISRDCAEKGVIVVGVLKGAFMFMADLVRELTIPVQIDFIRAASYGSDTASSGAVVIKKDVEFDIRNKDVLVVEDIVDSGLTIASLLDHLNGFHPRSLKLCALIDKRERRQVNVSIDYVGRILEGGFLVGYGLDVDEKYRALAEIYRLEPQ